MKSAPTAQRQSKRGKRAGKRKKRLWLWFLFVVVFAVVCAIVGYLLVILNGERILSNNGDKMNNMMQSTKIVDASGNEIKSLSVAGGNREYIPISDIPKKVQQAFVAVEDKRFYEHGGVDLWGIGRALVKDVIARSAAEGASTITQQVARNIFLNSDKTIFRKGTEASIALALENHKSKDEILELYLNRIYFGKGNWGIKTAAKYYFGVDDLNDLNDAEIAILAGIPKGPSIYNPVSNPDKSMDRRTVVLQLMKDQGLITEAEQQEALAWQYKAPKATQESNSIYTTYIDYVMEEAQQVTGYDEEQLLTGGYTIYTTIDTGAQKAMETEFDKDSNFEKSKDDTPIQGAMVIMDQHDGSLKAMIGGRDYQTKGWNRVEKPRQPGSSFKPIAVYGPAFETGDWFPWSNVEDKKQCYDKGKYCPSNASGEGYLGTTTITEAITNSRNQPAVWLLNKIGVKKGLDFASNLGIQLSSDDRNLAVALGGLTNGVSPLQMARAYGAFANGGQLQDAHSILKIDNSAGKSIYEFKSKAKQVMDPKTAYYITEAMKGVVNEGTGRKAKISGRTVAGKTGTTQLGISGVKSNGSRDIWFVGYTPEWTAAVWIGYDKTDATHYVSSKSGTAAALFSKVMSAALKGHEKLSFPKPEGVGEQQQQQTLPAVTDLAGGYDAQQGGVQLAWTPVTGDGITYKIYRKADGESDYSQVLEVAETMVTDMTVEPGKNYTYYVTAYQAANKLESDPSNQVAVAAGDVEPTPPPSGDGNGPTGDNGDGTVTDPSTDGQPPGATPTPGDNPGQGQGNGNGNGNGHGNGNGNGNGSGNGNGNGDGGSGQGGDVPAGTVTPTPSPSPQVDTGVTVTPIN